MRNGGDTGRERGREGERENTRLGGGGQKAREMEQGRCGEREGRRGEAIFTYNTCTMLHG